MSPSSRLNQTFPNFEQKVGQISVNDVKPGNGAVHMYSVAGQLQLNYFSL